MLRNVFTKSLRDVRRAFVGWSIGMIALVLLEAALWPSIKDMPDLSRFLESYPEPMRELFNLEDFGTGAGFMNAELFSLLLPILFIVFAVGRGARAIGGEEEAGTLDILLVTRISVTSLVLQQAAALVVMQLALGAVLFLAFLIFTTPFDLGIGVVDLTGATLAMVGLGIEFGLLALAVGAVTGRRAIAISVASVAAVGTYVLYVAGQLVSGVEPWQPISPFYQVLSGGPLGAGIPARYLWLPLVGAVLVAAAIPVFSRRDIAAG